MAAYSDQLNAELKEAMKSKDNKKRDAIRLLTSAFKQVEVDTRKELTSEIELDILNKEAKKRRESIVELEKAGRAEQLAQEQYELDMIVALLPKQLSQEEIEAIVKEAIAQTGATTAKEMGKVMGVVSPKTKGLADGKLVSDIVKALLS